MTGASLRQSVDGEVGVDRFAWNPRGFEDLATDQLIKIVPGAVDRTCDPKKLDRS